MLGCQDMFGGVDDGPWDKHSGPPSGGSACEERRYAGGVAWLAGLGQHAAATQREPPVRSEGGVGERRGGQRGAERIRAHRDEVGKVAHVAQALSDLDGVQLAEDLAGPYDVVVARVQAPGLNQLGRLVVSRIQVVDGVTRTLTCMVIQR